MKYTEHSYRGYKTTLNEIDAALPNGEKIMLFKSLDPYETPKAIESICYSYQIALEGEFVDPLILISCVILDSLCVHLFSDGNGV